VWVAGKLVDPIVTREPSDQFRDKELIYKVLYKFRCILIYLFKPPPQTPLHLLPNLKLTSSL